MRKKPKTDANQSDIVKAIRSAGGSVQILAAVGAGCPDLLVGWQGFNILIEVKSEKGKLTPDQQAWWREWRGGVPLTVRTPYEAIKALNLIVYIKDYFDKSIKLMGVVDKEMEMNGNRCKIHDFFSGILREGKK